MDRSKDRTESNKGGGGADKVKDPKSATKTLVQSLSYAATRYTDLRKLA